MAKLKIAHTRSDSTVADQKVRGADADSIQPGGTGGQGSSITSEVSTINVVYIDSEGTEVESGYIIAQKGAHKFRVANAAAEGENVTTVTLANVTGNTATILAGLSADEGVITFYPPTGSGNTQVAATRITNKFVYDFDGNKYRYKLGGNATATYGNVSAD